MSLSNRPEFMHAGHPREGLLFFALPDSLAAFRAHFPAEAAPWEWLKAIGPALEAADLPPAMDGPLPGRPQVQVTGRVYLHPTVKFFGPGGPDGARPGIRTPT